MKKILLISIMLLSVAVFAKESKTQKQKQNRVTNNSGKSAIQNCADRGHVFNEDSTLFVQKSEEVSKSYLIDYPDSTVQVTPVPYNVHKTCLRCGKKVIEQTADRREVIWRRPVIVIDQPIIINGVEYD